MNRTATLMSNRDLVLESLMMKKKMMILKMKMNMMEMKMKKGDEEDSFSG